MKINNKVICVAGTCPEAIKMMPLVKELQKADDFGVLVLATAQHRDLLDQAFYLFRSAYDNMAVGASFYGDGKASKRIVEILRNYFDRKRI